MVRNRLVIYGGFDILSSMQIRQAIGIGLSSEKAFPLLRAPSSPNPQVFTLQIFIHPPNPTIKQPTYWLLHSHTSMSAAGRRQICSSVTGGGCEIRSELDGI